MANYNILKNLMGTKLKDISLCTSIRQQWCGKFGWLVSTFASQHNLPHPSQQISRYHESLYHICFLLIFILSQDDNS